MAMLGGCGTTPTAGEQTNDVSAHAVDPTTEPKKAAVPALVGMTLADVKASLRAAGLTVGAVERQPSAKAPGTVLRQGASPGASLESGSPVTLVVAAPLPEVPNVVGIDKAGAVSTVKAAGFGVKILTESTTSGDDNVVLSESPAGGSHAKPGATVSLVISDLQEPRTLSSAGSSNCTPGYDPCLPPATDYDCEGGSGDGPKYTGLVHITGSDPYDLDRDGDGTACEPY